MEKDLNVSMLLEIYGELLTKKQSEILDRYYNMDSSLQEIATEFDVARQTVRDAIVKGKNKLEKFEETLKIYDMKNLLQDLCKKEHKQSETLELAREILNVLEEW